MATEDLYAILGVEAGAPTDEIRAAYRKQVREHHPDRKQSTSADLAEADARMAALNHAWEVLSDPVRRRLYDEQRHVDELLSRRPGEARSQVGAVQSASSPGDAALHAEPVGAWDPVRSPSSLQASFRLREKVLSTRDYYHWEREALDGFEWALAGRVFLARYTVALRFEPAVDPERARRFVEVAAAAAQAARSSARHDLFLLLVERANALEQVRRICREFATSESGKGSSVVLVDATRSRALLCSPPPGEQRMRRLLELFGA